MSFISRISEIVKAYTDDQRNEIIQESRLQSAPSDVISLLHLPKKDPSLGSELFPSMVKTLEVTPSTTLRSVPETPSMHQYIFISYSHKDKKWLEKVQVMLTPLVRSEMIKIWADSQIYPGCGLPIGLSFFGTLSVNARSDRLWVKTAKWFIGLLSRPIQ
jgi:hypothetical protein